MQFERTAPEGIVIRKKFLFPPTTEKKDNFVAEMQVDFQQRRRRSPMRIPDYFVALGSALVRCT